MLFRSHFDGCMYGLRATRGNNAGKPIKKPWRVAYVNSSIGAYLNKRCDGSHEHTPCAGSNTSETERYTRELARQVHDCLRRCCDVGRSKKRVAVASAAVSRITPMERPASGPWDQVPRAAGPAEVDEEKWPALDANPSRYGEPTAEGTIL